MPTSIESPCIKLCKLDASGQLCLGCYRTRGEIGAWSTAPEHLKVEIVKRAKKRQEGDV